MYKKAGIFVLALLVSIVIVASTTKTGESTEEKPLSESRLAAIEKKLDQLIQDQKSVVKKLDEMETKLDKIESLIKTRTR